MRSLTGCLAFLAVLSASQGGAATFFVADPFASEVRRYDGGVQTDSFHVEWATDVAIGPGGDLFVASQARSQSDLAEIVRVDPETGASSVFATTGIEGIFSVTLDSDGDVFASSALPGSTSKVTRYEGGSGSVLGSFVPGPVASPATGGLAFGPNGNLFVGEVGRILEYDGRTGSFLGVFASGNGLGATNGLAFATNGNLLVANTQATCCGAGAIVEFDPLGAYVRSFGDDESPVDLAFAPNGALFVSVNANVGGRDLILEYDYVSGAQRGKPLFRGGGHGFAVIPEPSIALLVGLGLAALAVRRS